MSLKIKFDIYQYGHIIETRTFTDYLEAQRFYLRRYFQYDTGEKIYVNNEELSFNQAYKFFNASHENQQLYGKHL